VTALIIYTTFVYCIKHITLRFLTCLADAGYQQVAAADEGSSTKSVVDESVEPEDFAKTPVNFADLPKELRQNVLTYAVHLRAPTKGPTTTIPPSTRRTPDL